MSLHPLSVKNLPLFAIMRHNVITTYPRFGFVSECPGVLLLIMEVTYVCLHLPVLILQSDLHEWRLLAMGWLAQSSTRRLFLLHLA